MISKTKNSYKIKNLNQMEYQFKLLTFETTVHKAWFLEPKSILQIQHEIIVY